jgi:GDP-D-mannose dehydratase
MMNQEEYSAAMNTKWSLLSNYPLCLSTHRDWIVKNLNEYVIANQSSFSVKDFLLLSLKAANIEYLDANKDSLRPISDGLQINITDLRGNPLVFASPKLMRKAIDLVASPTFTYVDLNWSPIISLEKIAEEMVLHDISLLTKKNYLV